MKFKKITECEKMVMKTVWDSEEELSLREIEQRVNDKYNKEWAPQTVSTFLARLVSKGYLSSYRQGKIFFYQKLISCEEYRKHVAKEFIGFWYRGSNEETVISDIKCALEDIASEKAID